MNRAPNQHGFSLIEVMCAILILGVGLVGLTEGIAGALRSTRESRLQTAAVLFAEGRLEMLRAEGGFVDGVSEGECGPGLQAHRWRQTVSRTDLDGLHDVRVTIEDPRDATTVCELRTLLFEAPTGSTAPSTRGGDSNDRARDKRRSRRSANRP